MINIQATREANENGNITNTGWIKLDQKTPDGPTKLGTYKGFKYVLKSGTLNVEIGQ